VSNQTDAVPPKLQAWTQARKRHEVRRVSFIALRTRARLVDRCARTRERAVDGGFDALLDSGSIESLCRSPGEGRATRARRLSVQVKVFSLAVARRCEMASAPFERMG
jgi:hypothetical protein